MSWTFGDCLLPFVEIIPLARCRKNGGTYIEHAGFELAVFRLKESDSICVIDNTCPHAGGNLSGGDLEGTIVRCPWHYWTFDLTTGACTDAPRARVRRYRSEIRDGVVWVDLPEQVRV